MGTETWNVCHGMGAIPSGRYESCYSCGGSAYGATTDTPCMACNGSGQSTSEIQDQCWNCNGLGTITNSDHNATPTKHIARSKQKELEITGDVSTNTSKNGKNSVYETISGISIVIALILAFLIYQEKSDIGPAIGAGFIDFLLSGTILYIGYFAVKIA